jgi:chemotaxis protein MotC
MTMGVVGPRVRAVALCALALAGGVGRARAEPAQSTPFEMMRALSILQDQIAAGNAIAQIGEVKMIGRMAARFASIDPVVWKDKRNARALILYLFGGGNAAALDGNIEKEQVAEGYGKLYEGAMAYALGDDAKARALLLPIDARAQPSGLGGHLALVQATLVTNTDRQKAMQLLDLARLLEPGTLVEEAALRKEMFLIGGAGDVDKFGLLARRYVHGFAKSIYAENFKQLEVKTAVEIAKGDTPASNAKLETLLNSVEKPDRRMIYLTVAQSAILEGRSNTARFAAAAAAKLSDKPDQEAARASVYLGASTLTGDDYDAGVKALRSVDPARLNDRDAALRASALEIATMIRSRASILDVADPAELAADKDGIQQIVSSAERALDAAEPLLQRSNP